MKPLSKRNLYCSHVAGREEMLYRLSNGTLNPAEQRALWMLLGRFYEQQEWFEIWEANSYHIEPAEDGYDIESWICPICGTENTETLDRENV